MVSLELVWTRVESLTCQHARIDTPSTFLVASTDCCRVLSSAFGPSIGPSVSIPQEGERSAPLPRTMAGGGWLHLASAAKELAGATGSKAKAVGQTLGKAVVSSGGSNGCKRTESSSAGVRRHIAGAAGSQASQASLLLHPVMRLQVATTKEVRHFVRDDGVRQDADGLDGEGPREAEPAQPPLQLVDAYGFSLTVTAEQAAILERCRAKQDAARQKWVQQVQQGGLPPTDALKKLCRKVGGSASAEECLQSEEGRECVRQARRGLVAPAVQCQLSFDSPG